MPTSSILFSDDNPQTENRPTLRIVSSQTKKKCNEDKKKKEARKSKWGIINEKILSTLTTLKPQKLSNEKRLRLTRIKRALNRKFWVDLSRSAKELK